MPRKTIKPPQRWTSAVTEHKMPSWVSAVLTIAGILVTLWIRSGSAAEQKGQVTSDLTHLQSTVNEIKDMIRQENAKHEYLARDVSELQREVAVLKSKVP